MSDDELLEMYEREWKSLMDKVNEVEENIVQIRKRITNNAAQQMLAPDVAESAPLQAFPTPETSATSQALSTPPTSG
jgi:hypothetical protein